MSSTNRKLHGYAGRILRINLSTRRIKVEEVNEKLARMYLGGRGFNIAKLYDEVDPSVDPLSPENKLMIATGPIPGTGFPLGARLNVS
ncbi:MAG: aldehyde ferredoxin oxidoreductase N-terminal domain-containing protein, partial [Desulfurococcaceae archaeon]